MAGDGRGKAGAGGLAVADALGEPCVELGDIVGRAQGHPVRDPAVASRDRQVGERRRRVLGALQPQLLALHRGAFGGAKRKVALVAVDLEQEFGAARHPAADLERHDRSLPDNAGNGELVGRGLGDDLAGSLERDAVALADHKPGKLAEFAEAMA